MTQDSSLSPVALTRNYEEYLVPALFLPWSQVLIDYAKPQVGDRVLDVACGTGIVARQIARRLGEQGHVAALDLNRAMLATAQSLAESENAIIEWREGSASDIPFADQSFDLVVCQQGLQFFPDQLSAIREMHRVLAHPGRVVISVNLSLEHNPVYEAFNEIFIRHVGAPTLAIPFAFGDEKKLEMLLISAGFRHVTVDRLTLPTNFPSAELFIRATILGSAAVVPAFASLNAAERDGLMQSVRAEMQDVLAPYIMPDGMVNFPVNVAIGHAGAE